MSNPENTQETLLGNEPATEQPAVETVADNVDTLPSVEEQFKALELKAAEHYDAWQGVDVGGRCCGFRCSAFGGGLFAQHGFLRGLLFGHAGFSKKSAVVFGGESQCFKSFVEIILRSIALRLAAGPVLR